MEVVEDEQALLARVADLLVDVWLVHPAGHGAGEEGAVVDATHVVAGATEAKGQPKDEDGRVQPAGVVGQARVVQHVRREDGGDDAVVAVVDVAVHDEQAPNGVHHEQNQGEGHRQRRGPPRIFSVGSAEAVDDGETNALTDVNTSRMRDAWG